MDKNKFLMENFFLFKGISSNALDSLLTMDGISECTFAHGDIIQNCNNCDRIGIVVKGKAFVRSGIDGVIINKLGKNDIYGAAALFDKPTHITLVQASTDCSVITMDKSFIEHCISKNSIASLNYIQFLAQKISFLNKKINAYTAKSAENKLYTYLLQIPRNGNELMLQQDMSTIAKMLGIGRATLYRSFEKLEKNGIITKIDKKIIFNEV